MRAPGKWRATASRLSLTADEATRFTAAFTAPACVKQCPADALDFGRVDPGAGQRDSSDNPNPEGAHAGCH